MKVGVAIIGLGELARDEYVKAVKSSEYLDLKAVYSPSQALSKTVAKEAGTEAYFDGSDQSSHSLDTIFKRKDIKAVIISLHGSTKAEVIVRAFTAGKHVLSDSPIAENVAVAEKLFGEYRANDGRVLWSVGEEVRFKENILWAYRQLEAMDGRLETFHMKMHCSHLGGEEVRSPGSADRPSETDLSAQIAVHCVAALRMLLSAADESIVQVAAFASPASRGQAPRHNLNATMRLSGGKSGTFNFSYGTQYDTTFEVQIMTDKGSATVTDSWVTVVTDSTEAEKTKS